MEKKALNAAFRLLAIKSRLSSELEKKLQLKGFEPACIDYAIKECKRLGYLNDERELQTRVRRGIEKGHGPRLIIAKLQSKGASADAALIKEMQESQAESIGRLLQMKKYAKNLVDAKSRQKVIASLLRRGFDLNVIYAVLVRLK